jgi:hypothetical protein
MILSQSPQDCGKVSIGQPPEDNGGGDALSTRKQRRLEREYGLREAPPEPKPPEAIPELIPLPPTNFPELSPQHHAHLQSEGFDDAAIANYFVQAGARSVTEAEAKSLNFWVKPDGEDRAVSAVHARVWAIANGQTAVSQGQASKVSHASAQGHSGVSPGWCQSHHRRL